MNLLELTCGQLADAFERNYGKGLFHAAAVYRSFFNNASARFSDLPELRTSPGLLEKIEKDLSADLPPVEKQVSEQDVVKLAFRLGDGARVETVVIPMENHTTVCVSSQVGCRMGCRFCRTGRMGLKRNLTTAEIVAQVYTVKVVMGLPVRNIVFMGMGEPLDNIDQLIQAIRVLEDQRGLDIAKRHITISTAGLVPGILRLAAENWPQLKLAVSLNAPNDDIRSRLMPVNRAYSMSALKKALQTVPLARGNALFMEYVQIRNVNDAPEHARELSAYLRDLPVKLNLIPCNAFKTSPFETPTEQEIDRFRRALVDQGIFVRLRGSKGADILAACGQLGTH